MADIEEQSISGNVLAEARKNTEKILARKNLSTLDRINFENQNLLLLFIEINNRRTSEMYNWYQLSVKKENRWEPRAWDVFKSALLLGVGYLLAVR